ncbi:MAG: hypothetical protein ABIQ24_07180 [Nitrospiraceae bacterium]
MGLFVLLGFIAYVLVATFIVSAIGKYGGSKIAKYVTIAVFVLIPAWDIIPGQLYFQHLCETEAGVKVIKTMKMDQSYFKSDGKPDEKKLAERYAHVTKFDRNFSAIFHIAKTESTIQDKQTKEILGTAANFSHRGGWLTTLVLVDAAGTSCPAYPFFAMHSAVLESVFRPSVLRPT